MIQIEEAQLHSINKNANQELIVKLRIKKTDYTPELEEQLYNYSDNKEVIAIVMQPFTQQVVQVSKSNKIQKLCWIMQLYADKQNIDISDLKQKLYTKYWILSRKELSESEIEEETKNYQAGLEYD